MDEPQPFCRHTRRGAAGRGAPLPSFFKMFEIQANAADISAEAARKREENNQAARGLIGASAGFWASGENPVK